MPAIRHLCFGGGWRDYCFFYFDTTLADVLRGYAPTINDRAKGVQLLQLATSSNLSMVLDFECRRLRIEMATKGWNLNSDKQRWQRKQSIDERRFRFVEIRSDMAEEHRCEAPEGHRLCANNCGFIGSPATLNLCSKCYRDLRLKEQQASDARSAVEKSLSLSPPSPSSSSSLSSSSSSSSDISLVSFSSSSVQATQSDVVLVAEPSRVEGSQSVVPVVNNKTNRCSVCRKRVGLMVFKCRCGITFCGSHRHPEQHFCTFDYKTVGREEIAKANPIVKADKLEKI
ncbi:Zinc finger, AN1-type [Dillenia turbinata]|uniref:Zinc finger, AN1-type n=1 Tax=Dillenia turbinata TaxID=194707 RepID=A0AAN8VXB5_9MAGN